MYLLYSVLFTISFVLLLPWFLFRALRDGKYVAGFRERLGNLTPKESEKPRIWIHCVSVGETRAARSLLLELKQLLPSHSIVVSTTTLTGQALARELFKTDADRVFYFPFDWGFSVRRTLKRIAPTAVLLMETEIWPNFLNQCGKRLI